MRTGHIFHLLSTSLLCSAISQSGTVEEAKPSPTPLYKNPNAPIEDRVNDLIGRMTVEEKVAQMCVLLLGNNTPFFIHIIEQNSRGHGRMDGFYQPFRRHIDV